MLSDHFGSNPNTPYMFNVLPLCDFLFPSPICHIKQQDCVVLLARVPPRVEYFSFTTFAAWIPGQGVPFSSVADSVNNFNIKATADGLFAHVVTANQHSFGEVKAALVASGLPASAINLIALPTDLGLWAQRSQ